MSKIVPIFKVDDETDNTNYRPISLFANFNTIFEKNYVRQNETLLKSTAYYIRLNMVFVKLTQPKHAILDMVETIQINMNKKLFSRAVFYWLKKAFDTENQNHTILLDKLNYYVLCGIVNQWFSSYLSNRTQTTEIGSHISSKLNINCGVPQGSVLGPLLFLLYINDIQYCSNKLQFFLFADDTNALYAY